MSIVLGRIRGKLGSSVHPHQVAVSGWDPNPGTQEDSRPTGVAMTSRNTPGTSVCHRLGCWSGRRVFSHGSQGPKKGVGRSGSA